MTIELEGPARGTWKNEATGEQGNLFDIVHGRGDRHNDITVTMEAARAFLEGEHEARRQLAAELAPHAEVLWPALPSRQRQAIPPSGTCSLSRAKTNTR